jgi:hypothetical protein
MTRSDVVRSLVSFAAFVGLSLSPISAFAQHGGGGHGGGFHGGGGGGFHAGSEGGFHSSGGGGEFSRGGGEYRGGGFEGGARSLGRGGTYRGGSAEAGRSLGSTRSESANIRPAINDGQWHSFGNSRGSARLGAGRNPGDSANSNLVAHNTVGTEGGWRSFGSVGSVRGEASFIGGGGFRGAGFGFRGGYGRGCCWGGLGFGFGIGWPYWGFGWGPAWAFWNPWWYGPYYYGPYWYGAWPGYNYGYDYSYDDYSDMWSTNPPPYRPDASQDKSNTSQPDNLQVYPARPSDDEGASKGTDSLDSAGSNANDAAPQPSISNAPNAIPQVQPSIVAPAVI